MTHSSDRESDLELLRGFRAGDEAAFRQLLAKHGSALSARIRRNLPVRVARRVAVSDVLQEACVVAFRRREHLELRGENAFRNWLLGIVDNKVREAVRRHAHVAGRSAHREVSRNDRPDTDLFIGGAPSPSRHAQDREELECSQIAMTRLPAHYRQVIELTRIRGLALREAAEHMGRTREATKKLFGRAVCRLKAAYEEVLREARSG